jgi:hypothetical protein
MRPMIAHYKLEAKLGEGGMGEVYRATDTKLGRDVAIKVIPVAYSGDARRMARFAREAQVLAALNHPNIAAIYSVEENALVMELVKGPTLAERIAEGPMPVKEALAIARQIAEALEYAHHRHVVHRDLKPANVKLTGPASGSPGRVKVLDFGLAKLRDRSEEGEMASTQTMAIVGSPGYLAPEQLEGKPADERSDIFAFGCLLYELLSARRAFPGATMAASLAATAIAEPKAIKGAPKELEKLVLRCLRKDPAHRIQSMGDVRVALEDLGDGFEQGGVSPVRARLARFWLGWIAAGLLVLAAVSATLIHLRERPPDFRTGAAASDRRGEPSGTVQQAGPQAANGAPAAKGGRDARGLRPGPSDGGPGRELAGPDGRSSPKPISGLPEEEGKGAQVSEPPGQVAKVPAATAKAAILAAADAARERLRAKMRQGKSPASGKAPAQAGSVIDQQDLVDLATIGAEHLLTGSTRFADWSIRVMKDVGDLVNWVAVQTLQSPDQVLRQVHDFAQAVAAKFVAVQSDQVH